MHIWNSDFDKFIGSCLGPEEWPNKDEPTDSIKTLDYDIGRHIGFKRLAVHHVVLPAKCRTSFPHAESLEEEFVLVLEGSLHLWLNGFVYSLKEGHAIGFPAGTGDAHTFINNTDTDVRLLVAGEKTKPENLCSYPVNPELKDGCEFWWDTPPRHTLGPHNGTVGTPKPCELGNDLPGCVVYCPDVEPGKSFHYPGDKETFGEGFRITDKVGMKALGVWYESLPAGHRSAFPHAHTHEEEFVYVLKGSPTVWLDGYTKELKPGDFVAFPSNTGLSHAIINDTDEKVVYLCIGETQEFLDEKITYPLNPLRNNECSRKGWLWSDLPQKALGPHNGRQRLPFENHLSLRLCGMQDLEDVLAVCRLSPNYFEKVDGCLPTKNTARLLLEDKPVNRTEKYFKECLIVEQNHIPIGLVDLHVNHPKVGECYLSLLLIVQSLFGNKIGTKCYFLIEDYVKRSLECSEIKLGISDANDVEGFWNKVGFKADGTTYKWQGEKNLSNIRGFFKTLAPNQ